MNERESYELEYNLNTSAKLLYSMIASPEGLSKWFAPKVDQNGKEIIFDWNGSFQKAEVVSKKINESIKLRWLELEYGEFFELKIISNELTNAITLVITDTALADEKEDSIKLWEDNIKKLKRAIGVM